jgi:site-specific recombinase XerD
MKALKDHLQDYFDWRRSLMLSPETISKNKYGIKPFLTWLETTYQITTPEGIYKDHLFEWQKHIAGMKNRQGHPIKPRTINTYNEGIKGFLTWLADNGHIRKSYPDMVRYVKKPITLPGSILPHAKMRKMLSAIPTGDLLGYRDRAMLELLYSSGVRSAELLGLNTFDVDFKNRTMMVTGKGSKQRVVPIGRTAMRHLETYIKAVRPYLLRDRRQNALFLNHKGGRLKYRAFLKCVHTHSRRLGYDDVSPHTFRRSCTTELVRGGANMYHVKELLGHESLDTLKHYTKLTINDLKKTHEKCHPRERDSE